MMNNKDFDTILDECFDLLRQGRSVADCLDIYPDFADNLKPFLTIFVEYSAQNAFIPSADAKAHGKASLKQRIADLRQVPVTSHETLLQRIFGKPLIWVPVAAALVLVFIGIAIGLFSNSSDDTVISPIPEPTESVIVAKTGVLEILVTDAPAYDISAVNMTISDIEVHMSGTETVSGWETIVSGSRSFELLALRGVEEFLGSSELAIGHYTQIRLNIDKVLVTVDGEVIEAKLPSGTLKLIGSFSIEADSTTALTIDFDAKESVTVSGNGKVNFKPTVKLLVSMEEEKISESPVPTS